MSWSPKILWVYGILALLILVWEFMGIRTGGDGWPSITQIVVKWASTRPWAKIFVLGFIIWLFIHFYRRLF